MLFEPFRYDLRTFLESSIDLDAPIDARQAMHITYNLCAGIAFVHSRRVIHRDLKGQNIFMTTRGFVKIGDLGIAKVLT